MSVSRVQVELNQVHGLAPALDAARHVVDFAASPLAVPTGTDQSRSLDLAGDRGELIRASGALVRLTTKSPGGTLVKL